MLIDFLTLVFVALYALPDSFRDESVRNRVGMAKEQGEEKEQEGERKEDD